MVQQLWPEPEAEEAAPLEPKQVQNQTLRVGLVDLMGVSGECSAELLHDLFDCTRALQTISRCNSVLSQDASRAKTLSRKDSLTTLGQQICQRILRMI